MHQCSHTRHRGKCGIDGMKEESGGNNRRMLPAASSVGHGLYPVVYILVVSGYMDDFIKIQEHNMMYMTKKWIADRLIGWLEDS